MRPGEARLKSARPGCNRNSRRKARAPRTDSNPRGALASGIPTSNCINRNIARYGPASRRDCIGKRFCNAVHANWTKIHPVFPRLRSSGALARPSAARGSRGSPSVEGTRRDRDRLSLLVSVTVGKVRAYTRRANRRRNEV